MCRLQYYSEFEYLVRAEQIAARIMVLTTENAENLICVFESVFQELLHSLYSNYDEKINRWR
jgi:hypothetical protein